MSHLRSSVVPPLEDEDLLEEILLRLPPQPSSLPRASLVCKRWRSVLSSPQFFTRFRKRHGKPPLLGFFVAYFGTNPVFTPVLDPPNRIQPARFSLPWIRRSESNQQWLFKGCRHGLAVLVNDHMRRVLLWDPITGQQRHLSFPPGLGNYARWGCHAAVVCADVEEGHLHGDCFFSPFKLVLISVGRKKTFACLFESASDSWGNIASTATDGITLASWPGILVGSALYWSFGGGESLMFDIERQTLGVIEKPAQSHIIRSWCFQLLRTDDGSGLVFALLSKLQSIHFWERKMNSDGVLGWVLQQKTIELEGMLPLGLPSNDDWVFLAGCDEDANAIVLSTWIGNFMLQLDSMQIMKIPETNGSHCMAFFPYANFCTAGTEVEWKWLDLKL